MVAAGVVVVVGAVVPEGTTAIVELERAVMVPTIKTVNGYSQVGAALGNFPLEKKLFLVPCTHDVRCLKISHTNVLLARLTKVRS